MKIVHIITGLTVGGAENMLCKLVTRLNSAEVTHEVVSLSQIGPLGERMLRAGIPVSALGMQPGRPDPRAVVRLAGWLRQKQPDLILTWLYHADVVGGIANKMAGDFPLAWNIRRSYMDRATLKRSTYWLGRLCCRLSYYLPGRILCCSQAGLEERLRLGYDTTKMEIIPNGFDTECFRPDVSARQALRAELGLPSDTQLIGMMGRFHRMKDHRNLIQAAALLHHTRPDVHFVCAGTNVTWQNPELTDWILSADLCANFHLLGPRTDIPMLTAGLDIATLSSQYGEGGCKSNLWYQKGIGDSKANCGSHSWL